MWLNLRLAWLVKSKRYWDSETDTAYDPRDFVRFVRSSHFACRLKFSRIALWAERPSTKNRSMILLFENPWWPCKLICGIYAPSSLCSLHSNLCQCHPPPVTAFVHPKWFYTDVHINDFKIVFQIKKYLLVSNEKLTIELRRFSFSNFLMRRLLRLPRCGAMSSATSTRGTCTSNSLARRPRCHAVSTHSMNKTKTVIASTRFSSTQASTTIDDA